MFEPPAAGRRIAYHMFVVSLLAVSTSVALAQVNDGTPDDLEDITIHEQLDAQIPLDLTFVDDQRRTLQLRDYFKGDRPIIITLNYYRCPMLCGLMLNGMVDALKQISLEPGEDFELLTISFDPLEKPDLAKAKKENYVREYGRRSAQTGWHFLTGNKEDIKTLTSTVGFKYRWVEDRQEWAHPSALIICTPDGRVSRYLGGVTFDPQTVRLSLVEASEGKIGTLFDQVFLSCFHYVPRAGYAASAMGVMRLGGGVTLALIAIIVLPLWLRETTRRKRQRLENAESSST